MSTFEIPFVAVNPSSWGPPSAGGNPNAPAHKFADLPYSPFGRSDRLGRAADLRGRRRPEEDFQLVDTAKAVQPKRFVNPASKRRQHTQRLRQINARRQGTGGNAVLQAHSLSGRGGGRGGRGGPAGGRGGGGRGGRGGRGYDRHQRVDRAPSVAVQDDWVAMEEVDLGKITKNIVMGDVPEAQDVIWCGFLDPYNEAYDKVTTRQAVPLKKNTKKFFYPVSTTDDPVLEKLAIDGVGNVFFTDAILSHLMTCSRSVYPWDIVVHKLADGTLFFDKRDQTQFDLLTVHETAYNPPSEEDRANSAARLSLESTIACQNFSQQILKKSGRKKMDLPHPFYDEEEDKGIEPASVAYRYRKWKLSDDLTLVCRTELHGTLKGTQNITAFALNEYVPPNSTNNSNVINWRDKIDAQRGAVMATELKNNSFKVAKWTAQSILAGADHMKIGFVSRASPKVETDHVILATQFYRPKDFAQQITLHEGQIWAVLRLFVNLVAKQKEAGKYVLMRDPNKPVVRLYKVPLDTFEEEAE